MFNLKEFFLHDDSHKETLTASSTNQSLAECSEFDSINLMNASINQQELLEHCFHYNIFRA